MFTTLLSFLKLQKNASLILAPFLLFLMACVPVDDGAVDNTDSISVSDPTQSSSSSSSSSSNTSYGVVSISWTAPTENTDNTQLTDLAGFKIYYGTSANQLVNVVTISSSQTYTKVIDSLLIDQTYFFAVSAYNKLGVESDLSAVSSKFISG